ncbi:MAG: sugar phosphate isomerase/epimerase [Bacteroidetes bacterium]|nr:sugar phosphate isomerase/epimerase [Bacteroidota bacterium]
MKGRNMHFKNLYLNTLLIVILSVQSIFSVGSEKNEKSTLKWPLTAYNFGGLDQFSPEEQIDLLHKNGYKGIIIRGATASNVQNLDHFILKADKIPEFDIQAVFIRYNFTDKEEDKDRWKKVVDKIAGSKIQLWVIFGKNTLGINDDFIESKLREMVNYSSQKDVEVILYPHSTCYIESAEEALPFVEKINHPKLKLAFHLYHEIRAGNGSRIDEVFEGIKDQLGAVTMAGTDSIADFSLPRTMNTSTIKVLGQGNFDMRKFILPLSKSGYMGSVGFMNFKIEDKPEVYLESSLEEWENLISGCKPTHSMQQSKNQ